MILKFVSIIYFIFFYYFIHFDSILYIEVKSTKTNDKHSFEISMNEVLFAEEKGDNYAIYRVFNAGR